MIVAQPQSNGIVVKPPFPQPPPGGVRFYFHAWLSETIRGHKLLEFLREEGGRLVDTASDHISVVIGPQGFRWRRTAPFAVQMTVYWRPLDPPQHGATHLLAADLCPLSRRIVPQHFHQRSASLARSLRYWLEAQGDEAARSEIRRYPYTAAVG